MILDVIDRLEELDGRVTVESVARIPNLKQPLQIGRQLHTLTDEQDEATSEQGHCRANLDEHVGFTTTCSEASLSISFCSAST